MQKLEEPTLCIIEPEPFRFNLVPPGVINYYYYVFYPSLPVGHANPYLPVGRANPYLPIDCHCTAALAGSTIIRTA